MTKERLIGVAGNLVNHDSIQKGVVWINSATGLIEKIGNCEKAIRYADYKFLGDEHLILPGMIDVHIHAREDESGKQNYKEDYKTASDAVLNGGVCACCAMPNTPEPLTNQERLTWHRRRIQDLAHPVAMLNYIGIDANTEPLGKPGEHMYKLYFGKSVGSLSVIDIAVLDKILSKYAGHYISFHVEDEYVIQASKNGETHADRRPREAVDSGLAKLLPLILKYNIKAKLCHWSTGGYSFKLIEEYRRKGTHIELEVSPLHLLFDRVMADKDPALWLKIQMNPAVQDPSDRQALIEWLKNGKIQHLATDHAPHTEEEKYRAFEKYKGDRNISNVAFAQELKEKNPKLFYTICKEDNTSGAPWLDTYAAVAAHLIVREGFTPQDIARVTAYNPGRFINRFLTRQYPGIEFGKGFGKIAPGYVAALTVLNMNPRKIRRKDLKTKVRWSPLEGMIMPGFAEAVFIRGKKVK